MAVSISYRDYQKSAIAAGLDSPNGIIVAPTGSGKSVICAGLVDGLEGGTLILQPSKEVLESNIAKARAIGIDAAVFSASMNSKAVGRVTYATIKSIIGCLGKFSHVKNVLIDEAHLVNAKGGQYEQLIAELKPTHLVGMTATPYRMATNSLGTFMRVLTRTRPKLFDDIVYNIHSSDLVRDGFLLNPEFVALDVDDSMLVANSTGADFTAASLERFSKANHLRIRAAGLCEAVALKHRSILIFSESVADSQFIVDQLNALGVPAAEINAKTPSKARALRLEKFHAGEYMAMVNVGTLTTGYDFPALGAIIDARPIMSVALHYQKIGRVVRPFPGKRPVVYDLAGNYARLGNPLEYRMLQGPTGLWDLYAPFGRLTSVPLGERESCGKVGFGKHADASLYEIPQGYLEWGIKELKAPAKQRFAVEAVRREAFGGGV